jgi:hypothetical protein
LGTSEEDQPRWPGWLPGMELTALEEVMRAKAAVGELVDRGEGPFDEGEMLGRGKEETIRAAVLRHLLITDEWPVDVKGIWLRGVPIAGHLDLEAATLRCPLALQSCYLDAEEAVNLSGATALFISLERCHLVGISGEMLTVKQLDLSGTTFSGAVSLLDAHIAGQLFCRDVTLNGRDENGNALYADAMKAGDVFLNGRFTADTAAVRLAGADITGQLNCQGAHLNGTDSHGNALVADRLNVGSGVFLCEMFTAVGAVRLVGADITGQLNCGGAHLNGTDSHGNALVANGMRVSDDVFIDRGFTAAGNLSLVAARFGGSVVFKPTALAGEGQIALDMARAQIAGAMWWAPAAQVSGCVTMEGASLGELADDWAGGRASANGYWPSAGLLRLNGFTYDRLGGDHQPSVEQRLGWVRSQYRPEPTMLRTDGITAPSATVPPPAEVAAGSSGSFAPEPYEQLAKVYRHAGKDREARKVAIAGRVDERRYGDLDWYRKAGNWFFDKTIKFGYQTRRAALGLAMVFVAFLVMSLFAQHHHAIVPVNDLVVGVHPVPVATRCAPGYPCFYPLGYTADVVIPVINVHQADFWGLNGWGLGRRQLDSDRAWLGGCDTPRRRLHRVGASAMDQMIAKVVSPTPA